jgi:hypothetical protein
MTAVYIVRLTSLQQFYRHRHITQTHVTCRCSTKYPPQYQTWRIYSRILFLRLSRIDRRSISQFMRLEGRADLSEQPTPDTKTAINFKHILLMAGSDKVVWLSVCVHRECMRCRPNTIKILDHTNVIFNREAYRPTQVLLTPSPHRMEQLRKVKLVLKFNTLI